MQLVTMSETVLEKEAGKIVISFAKSQPDSF